MASPEFRVVMPGAMRTLGGSSVGFTIPKPVAEYVGLAEGQRVTCYERENALYIVSNPRDLPLDEDDYEKLDSRTVRAASEGSYYLTISRDAAVAIDAFPDDDIEVAAGRKMFRVRKW